MTHARSASTLRTVAGPIDVEWDVARLGRANLLLVGSDGSVEKFVDALRRDFRQPVAVWRPDCRLVLPPLSSSGTFILQDVGAIPHDDQRRLCDWLGATAGRTRVVSTTRQPLFQLLEAGTFLEALYYRLNVLCFEVTECDT